MRVIETYFENKEKWDSQYHDVYVELDEGVTASGFEKSSQSFVDLHYKEGIEMLQRDGASADSNGRFIDLRLVPLTDIHFTSLKSGFIEISRNMPYLILGVAFLDFIHCLCELYQHEYCQIC